MSNWPKGIALPDAIAAVLTDHDIGNHVLGAIVPHETWAGLDLTGSILSDIATKDHDLLDGLLDDDHTIYAILAGRAAGQTIYGSQVANKSLEMYNSLADRVANSSSSVSLVQSNCQLRGSRWVRLQVGPHAAPVDMFIVDQLTNRATALVDLEIAPGKNILLSGGGMVDGVLLSTHIHDGLAGMGNNIDAGDLLNHDAAAHDALGLDYPSLVNKPTIPSLPDTLANVITDHDLGNHALGAVVPHETWAGLDLTGSSLVDLATRNYSDLNNRSHGVYGADHTGIGRGTSFPGVPSDGDIYYRTDLYMMYHYDGSRSKWLTESKILSFGRNTLSRVADSYLGIADLFTTSTEGTRMLRNGTIVGVSVRNNATVTRNVDIRVNNSAVNRVQIALNAESEKTDASANQDFGAGDKIQSVALAAAIGNDMTRAIVVVEFAWRAA